MKNIFWVIVIFTVSIPVSFIQAETALKTSIVNVDMNGNCKAQSAAVTPGPFEYVYEGSCEDFNKVFDSNDSNCETEFVARFGGKWKSTENTIDIGHNTLDGNNVLMILQRNRPTPSVGGTIFVFDKKSHSVRNERINGSTAEYKAYCVPKAGLIVVDFGGTHNSVFQVSEGKPLKMKWIWQDELLTKSEL